MRIAKNPDLRIGDIGDIVVISNTIGAEYTERKWIITAVEDHFTVVKLTAGTSLLKWAFWAIAIVAVFIAVAFLAGHFKIFG